MTIPYSKFRFILMALFVLTFFACESPSKNPTNTPFYQSDFFKQVQMAGIFEDSKTFVDCTAKRPLNEIQDLFMAQKDADGFDLESFVREHFDMPITPDTGFRTDTTKTMKQHLTDLWPVLTRQPDAYNAGSSLLPLPNEYIVPGGRFREIYYWDSYFTLEGLMVSDQQDMAVNMVDNFSFLIDNYSNIW